MQPPLHARCVVCGLVPVEVVCDAEDLEDQRRRLETFARARSPGVRPRQLETHAESGIAATLVACTRCSLLFHIPSLEGRELLAADLLGEEPESPLRPIARNLLRMDPSVTDTLTVISSPSGSFEVALERSLEALVREPEHAKTRSGRRPETDRAAVKRTLEDLLGHEPAASVDAVVMWRGFEALSEPRQLLHAAAHLLRPGGWFALRLPHGECFRALVPLLEEPTSQGGDFAELCLAWNCLLGFPYHHGYSLQSLDALTADAGFERRAVFGGTAGPLADPQAPVWARAEERALKRAQREWVRLEQRQLDASLAAAPWLDVYYRHGSGVEATPRSLS